MADAPTPPPPAPTKEGSSTNMIGDETDRNYVAPAKKTVEELMSTEGKEGEDEAMQRYKASLLGAAAVGGGKTDDPRRVVITKLELIINGKDAPLSYDMVKEENLNGGLSVQLKEGCEYKTQLTFRVQNELITGLKYKNNVAGNSSGITVLKVNEMLGSYGPDPEKTNTIVFPRREWEEGARRSNTGRCHACARSLPGYGARTAALEPTAHADCTPTARVHCTRRLLADCTRPLLADCVLSTACVCASAPSGMMARGTYKCSTSFVDDDGATHLAFTYKLVIAKDW